MPTFTATITDVTDDILCFIRDDLTYGDEQPHLNGPHLELVHDWPLVYRDDSFRHW